MNRSWTWRCPIALAMLATLLLGVSGCAGGVRATSWTGLTIAGGRVYAADLEQIVALDAADGGIIWAFPVDPKEDKRGIFYVTPAVDEKHVIVASQMPAAGFFSQPENIVWALDRETGARLWHFSGAAGQYVEGGALGGDAFVIGNSDGSIYTLDVENGDLRWKFETGHRIWATPLIISETVYIGSMDHRLYALRLSDGEVEWDFHADGAFASTPALRDDVLYVGAFDDRLYAIDVHTGIERWRFSGENWFWGSPAVYGDTVYAADVNGNIYAVDAETGEQVWRQSLDTPVRAGGVVSEDGSRLFVGAQDGMLYALDTVDGFVTWSQPPGDNTGKTEGQIFSPPVVSGSVVYETLVYGSHRVRARHVDNGREVWAYPHVVEEE